MASGCPVLVSKAAGCCEDLVEEGRNGWSFDPASPGELATLLTRLADDPGIGREMGRASAVRIASWGTALFAENYWRAARAALADGRGALARGAARFLVALTRVLGAWLR